MKSLFALTLFISQAALAAGLELINEDNLANVVDNAAIVTGGTGCPNDNSGTLAEFDGANNRLKITTRRYSMLSSEGAISRKNCALQIPVSVPAGKRIVFTQVDLNAVLDLRSGAAGHIQFEAFVTGTTGEVTARDFTGPKNGRAMLRSTNALQTECGVNGILRLNTSGRVQSSERNSSLDIERIIVDMRLESCS